MDLIIQKIKRKIQLSVMEYPEGTYSVKGFYLYSYPCDDGTVLNEERVILNRKMDAKKLKNIYFIFMPRYGRDELEGSTVSQDVVVDLTDLPDRSAVTDGKACIQDLSISFIRQNYPLPVVGDSEVADETEVAAINTMNSMSFNLNFLPSECSSNYLNANYYSDVEYDEDGMVLSDTGKPFVNLHNVITGGGDDNFSKGLLSREEKKRIAAIKVDVFRYNEDGDYDDDDILATTKTSKAE